MKKLVSKYIALIFLMSIPVILFFSNWPQKILLLLMIGLLYLVYVFIDNIEQFFLSAQINRNTIPQADKAQTYTTFQAELNDVIRLPDTDDDDQLITPIFTPLQDSPVVESSEQPDDPLPEEISTQASTPELTQDEIDSLFVHKPFGQAEEPTNSLDLADFSFADFEILAKPTPINDLPADLVEDFFSPAENPTYEMGSPDPDHKALLPTLVDLTTISEDQLAEISLLEKKIRKSSDSGKPELSTKQIQDIAHQLLKDQAVFIERIEELLVKLG